ncbi:MAG: DUF4345 family protein [Gammaproteobacteria bacterium]
MIVLVRFFPASLLALNGLIYGLLSVMFVLEPLRWFANLNIELQDPVGYTELRTTYIGLMASLALFSLLAAFHQSYRWPGLLLMAVSYAALAMTRLWGIVVEGSSTAFYEQLLVVEIISCGLALLGMVVQRQADARQTVS